MKAAVCFGLVLAVLSAADASAQQRKTLLCTENTSLRLKERSGSDASPTTTANNRKFSLVWDDEYMNLIFAGRSEFYECQKIVPRLNEGGPKNSIKCQNGIYFVTFDLSKLTFVKATLDPRDRSNVEVSMGSCGPIFD